MCTSEILSRLNTIENLLKKLIEHDHQETSKPLTFKEACAYLGYTQSYLYKLTYKKIIPHYKPTGKMIFFSKNEIDEWVYKNAEARGVAQGIPRLRSY
jgi:excisionase family DNA binding protein